MARSRNILSCCQRPQMRRRTFLEQKVLRWTRTRPGPGPERALALVPWRRKHGWMNRWRNLMVIWKWPSDGALCIADSIVKLGPSEFGGQLVNFHRMMAAESPRADSIPDLDLLQGSLTLLLPRAGDLCCHQLVHPFSASREQRPETDRR